MVSRRMASETDGAAILPDETEARAAFVLALRRSGVGAHAVLSAIERVPRRLFLPARHHSLAYADSPLPIECGQVVSAPSFVARVVEALDIEPHHRVLEVGTGSGYQAAVLGHLAARVDSVDRYKTLTGLAAQRIAALKIATVAFHHADGLAGLKSHAPFDRIVLTGAVADVPEVLSGQLAPDGVLIAPLGAPGGVQHLTRISWASGTEQRTTIDTARLVALTPGRAKRL